MTSKWALYRPNKVLYAFTDQNLFLWITMIPTNKSPKIINALLWATGQDIVPVRFIYHANVLLLRGLTSIIERSTTLTLRARITAPDRISYLISLPWYLMNKSWSRPTVRPILLTSLFVNLNFVPVSDLVLLCWLYFSPCRHNARSLNPTHK